MRAFAALFLILAACERGQPVPTAAENSDLDEAANMLDAAPNSLAGIDENALAPAGNGVEP